MTLWFREEKRGVDLGLGRGYSAATAARHMMGLHQANYALGPGRRWTRGCGWWEQTIWDRRCIWNNETLTNYRFVFVVFVFVSQYLHHLSHPRRRHIDEPCLRSSYSSATNNHWSCLSLKYSSASGILMMIIASVGFWEGRLNKVCSLLLTSLFPQPWFMMGVLNFSEDILNIIAVIARLCMCIFIYRIHRNNISWKSNSLHRISSLP